MKYILIFILVALFVVGPIRANNSARYVGNGRYDWTVFIVAAKSDMGSISTVEYTLHPSFPNPVRSVSKPPFALSANGWGEFNIKVKVMFKDKREPLKFDYWLRLFSK